MSDACLYVRCTPIVEVHAYEARAHIRDVTYECELYVYLTGTLWVVGMYLAGVHLRYRYAPHVGRASHV